MSDVTTSIAPIARIPLRGLARWTAWAALAASLAVGGSAWASNHGHGHGHGHGAKPGQAAAPAELVDGEVRRVDLEGGKLTIKHGEIRNIDMPPMTMVFEVRDRKMLDGLQPGSKIRFKVVMDGSKMVVTELQKG